MRGEQLLGHELCLQLDLDLARGVGKLDYLFAAQVPGNCDAWKVGGDADRTGIGRAVLEMIVSLLDELLPGNVVVVTLNDGSQFNPATAPLLSHSMTDYLRMWRGYSFYERNGFVSTPSKWNNEDTQLLLQMDIDWANLIFGTPLERLHDAVHGHYTEASAGLRRRGMKAAELLTGQVEVGDDTESDQSYSDSDASLDWGDEDEEHAQRVDEEHALQRIFDKYKGKSVRDLMVLLEAGLEQLNARPEADAGHGSIWNAQLRAKWAAKLFDAPRLKETYAIYKYLEGLRAAQLMKNDPEVGDSTLMTKVLRPIAGGHEEVYVDDGVAKTRAVPTREYRLSGMTTSVEGLAKRVLGMFSSDIPAVIPSRG